MENNTRLRSIKIDIDKLITLAELGLGAERPLNKEKRYWIKKLMKETNNGFNKSPNFFFVIFSIILISFLVC